MTIIAKTLISWALLGGLGCNREAGPSGVRKRPDAAAAATAPAQPPLPSAQPLPPADVVTKVTGEALRASMRASGRKATLLNAWATWCGPCRRELPMLQALAANLRLQGVGVVLVSVDKPEDEPKVLSFLKDNHITLESYLVDGSIGDFKASINPRWPGMLPASFLFDSRALPVHFWGGEAFEAELVPVIESFVAGRPIEAETRFGLAPGKVEK